MAARRRARSWRRPRTSRQAVGPETTARRSGRQPPPRLARAQAHGRASSLLVTDVQRKGSRTRPARHADADVVAALAGRAVTVAGAVFPAGGAQALDGDATGPAHA